MACVHITKVYVYTYTCAAYAVFSPIHVFLRGSSVNIHFMKKNLYNFDKTTLYFHKMGWAGYDPSMETKCAVTNLLIHFVGAGPPHFTAGRFKGVDQSTNHILITNQSVVVRTNPLLLMRLPSPHFYPQQCALSLQNLIILGDAQAVQKNLGWLATTTPHPLPEAQGECKCQIAKANWPPMVPRKIDSKHAD